MINFEKRFVHYFWIDLLEGKKGFVADTLTDLRSYVQNKNKPRLVTLTHSENEDFEFTSNNIDEYYQLCYYDPLYEMKVAYEEGKTIQIFSPLHEEWEDCNHRPLWNDSTEYRIKPEESDKYVPFENTQELIEAWEKKCPANKDRPNGTMPLIWIADKDDVNHVSLITDFGNHGVLTSYNVMLFNDLFEKCTFTDGSVCGKRK